MPRKYKPDPRSRRYKKYDEEVLNAAIEEYNINNKTVSLQTVADKYNINKSVLYRHCTRIMKKQGGQTVFSLEVEKHMIKYINICADWGYPFDSLDFRYFIKNYLDKTGRTVLKFQDNLPGPDFLANFLKRHRNAITQRNCQNIKRNRAAVSPESIKDYFKELETSLIGVDPKNLLNYDETNLCDDPGRKKILTKRGTKYPERVMNHSKASVSIMISATAAGDLLPPYVVYKAQNLYDTWTENGPPGTRYNRSKSGWFDANIFEDWIKTIILPYFRGKEGKKILIGDNLSSHLSIDVIQMCQEENISFVFLPSNSTHLTQPLDVAYFRPMKVAWRNILLKWKKKDGKKESCVPKGIFPKLLNLLMDELNKNGINNVLAGFRKTGINPIDQNQVLNRLPAEDCEEEVEKSILDYLKELRYGTTSVKQSARKRKLNVIAGRSVGDGIECENSGVNDDTEDYADSEDGDIKNKKRKEVNKGTKISKKGKGKGKKSSNQNQINTHENGLDENDKNTEEKVEDYIDSKEDDLKNVEQKQANKVTKILEKVKGKGKMTDKQNENNTKENLMDQNEKISDGTLDYKENEKNDENIAIDPKLFDLESMPFVYDDEFEIENEYSLGSPMCEENNKDRFGALNTTAQALADITIGNIEKEEKQKNKINIISIETFSKKIHVNKCKKISQNSYITKTKHVMNDEPKPSTSVIKCIPSRRPSFYKNDNDILRDLMDEDIK